jgi:hypothetical protein
LAKQKKARRVGRPKLPKGIAKGKIVPVRFSEREIKQIEAAKAQNQTISEYIRAAVRSANSRRGKSKWVK